MRISTVVNVKVPDASPVSMVQDDGDIWVWPEGVGGGPALTFTADEWDYITTSVEGARAARLARLARGYDACEGHYEDAS